MRTCCKITSVLVLGACLGLSACSRSSSDAAKSGADDDQNGVTGSAPDPGKNDRGTKADDPVSEKRAEPVAVISEADARAFLDRWLEAQNNGDFEAYQALYASRFEGVRRSGPKVVRLGRDGWMKERGRMFKRKMEVELSDMDIDVFAQSAILTFTQRWASGTYQDVGPKQLVVVRAGENLAIAREEMLASTLVGGDKATELASDSFLFLIDTGAKQYAVLDELGQVTTGARTLISRDEPVIVEAKISSKDLPVTLARWRGQKLDIGGCQATIEGISALSRVVPHFGERQVWDGEFDENEPYTEAQIADAAFYESAAYVVGELRYQDGAPCAAGAYAFALGHAGPASGEAALEPALESAYGDAATAAFRKLASFKEIQKDFEGYGHQGSWDEFEGGSGVQVSVTARPAHKDAQVVVSARSGFGCGDFEGGLTAHYLVSGTAARPKLELIHEGPYAHEILEVLDVDRDGTFEYLTKTFTSRELVSWSGDTQRTIAIGYYDCGC